MRKALYCSLQSLLLVTWANAQSAAVQDFGLVGEWASECARPPSPANEHSLFALASSGTIWVLNYFGPYYDGMVYRVLEAERIGPDKLSLRQVLTTDETMVLEVVMLKDNGKIRVWSSRTADGNTLVKDGIASAINQKTRWASHCGERWALDIEALGDRARRSFNENLGSEMTPETRDEAVAADEQKSYR